MTAIQSKYAKLIDSALAKPGALSELGKSPLVIAGVKQLLPVYRVPIDLLAFNLHNGRFAAELRAKQAELGRTLDARNAKDEKIIQRLLLDQNPEATKTLREDLKRVGQTDPGIITHDGSVINANRRMAILMALHADEPTGKFEYLEVMRLPEDISEKDLWRIEAGLQLSDDKRLAYGPINDLLKIREGLDAGLSPDEIAASLYGIDDPEEIKEKDARLTLIDDYLEYINQKGAYSEVNKQVEHFINLQNILSWMDRQGIKAKERHAWLIRAFELIRTGRFGHMDIRALRDMYKLPEAREVIAKGVKPIDHSDPNVDLKKRAEELREVFETARDVVSIQKETEKPERLLARAERLLTKLLEHQETFKSRTDLHDQVIHVRELAVELATVEAAKAKSGGGSSRTTKAPRKGAKRATRR